MFFFPVYVSATLMSITSATFVKPRNIYCLEHGAGLRSLVGLQSVFSTTIEIHHHYLLGGVILLPTELPIILAFNLNYFIFPRSLCISFAIITCHTIYLENCVYFSEAYFKGGTDKEHSE